MNPAHSFPGTHNFVTFTDEISQTQLFKVAAYISDFPVPDTKDGILDVI